MDTFITLIVIIVTIVSVISNIRKQQRKKSPRTGAQKPQQGLIAKLNAALADMQQQMEAKAGQQPKQGSPWDQLMDTAGRGRAQVERDDDSLEDLVLEDANIPEPPRAKPVARRAAARPTEKKRATPQPERPARQSQPQWAMDRAHLRRAVIWSEILAPPVALRKDHLEK